MATLTIESAAAYVDRKLNNCGITRDAGREMNMDGMEVVSFLLTDANGEDHGSFEVWVESNGELYGEY